MSLFPPSVTDVHTHRRDATRAIINALPGEPLDPDRYYSVGIHPWQAHLADDAMWDALAATAASPRVLAIGEAGIDRLNGPGLDIQTPVFERQIALSEALGKPMIIHMVRSADAILAARKRLKARQPWVIHGFRGKPQLARALVDAGCYISLGRRFNPQVPDAIPADRLLHETDDNPD